MKQTKTCFSSHFVIILAILLGGCGNKGPLVMPSSVAKDPKVVELATSEVESELDESQEKEIKK